MNQPLKELITYNAPINVMPAGGRQGMGWAFDCLCCPWGRAFDWSCSPGGGDIWIFLRPTWRYLTADSDEKDWYRICFPLPRFTHAPYGLKGLGSHGGQWKQAKAEWISLFCLQISFEPLNILWYQSNGSKEKPSRFLQVQLISAWLIRYNHCKLIKLTFFVPFTKNGIFTVKPSQAYPPRFY